MTESALAPFRAGLFRQDGEAVLLIASKCGSCGVLAFPSRRVCAACSSTDEPKTFELSEYGHLYTYAIVRQAPKQFPVPYVIGYVDTDDGVRVFSQIVVDDLASLRLGARMRCVGGILPGAADGSGPHATYVYRLVDGE